MPVTSIPMVKEGEPSAKMVPMDQLEAARGAGWEVARKFDFPKVGTKWVPASKTQDAVQHGGKSVPNAPAAAPPQANATSRFLASALPIIPNAAKGVYHAATDKPEGVVENILNLLGPGTVPLKRMIVDPAIEQGKESISEFTSPSGSTSKGFAHALAALLPGVGPMAAQTGEKVGEQIATGDIAGAGGTLAGNAALLYGPKVLGKVGKVAGKPIGEALRRTYGPEEVPIGDQTVPVLKGEAHPETGPGSLQQTIKKSGVGARKFDKFAQTQQEAVKSVIRKTAQETSDLIGPVSQQPYAALDDASAAVFNRAKPMYQALDASLTKVPLKLTQVSKIMSDAIARARKLGVEIDTTENVQGIAPGSAQALQPLSTVTQIRSALLRAKRAAIDSGDTSLANSISDEVRTLHNEIDSSLSGTPLHADWLEANRLWSKGHAISDTARAFYASTKGTPEGIQSPQMSAVPTKVQGPSLVAKLNDLKREGTLDRGFTPAEQLNLRRSADILDRARESAGRDTGVAPGHLYSLHSALWRTLLRLPAIPLVRAMTTTEGMKALALAEKAKTPTQLQSALRTIYPIIAAGGYNSGKGQKK